MALRVDTWRVYLIVLWLILRTLIIGSSFFFFEHDFGCFRPGMIPSHCPFTPFTLFFHI